MTKRYFGGKISANKPTPTASTVVGVYNLTDQAQSKYSGAWPSWGGNSVSISPAYEGLTEWNFDVNGALNITSGNYTITPLKTFNVTLKMWGQGGFNTSMYTTSGAGGALTGTLVLTASNPLYLSIAGGGTGGSVGTPGDGGNYAGIFSGTSATQANAIAIAAGGGGCAVDDGGRGVVGGAGGYPTGQSSQGWSGTTATGGTQSAGGSGGGGSNPGTSGSALQGGAEAEGGACVGGGGGGGYYGGGAGGCTCCQAGSGGGGGSNYNSSNTSLITSVTQYSGSGSTPGNSSDPVRNGAGANNGGNARIYMTTS